MCKVYIALLAEQIAKTIKESDERVNEMKRRAEEAVNDVKRQAVIELKKAVTTAEEKASEELNQAQQQLEKAVQEARRQATEETSNLLNQQVSSQEVPCFNWVVIKLELRQFTEGLFLPRSHLVSGQHFHQMFTNILQAFFVKKGDHLQEISQTSESKYFRRECGNVRAKNIWCNTQKAS